MASMFASSSSRPGHGSIVLALLPSSTPVLHTMSCQYPLKLIAPEPATINPYPTTTTLVHTVYVLTYGGGLVDGDAVTLRVSLAEGTRICLLTQGSTKIFRREPSAPHDCRRSGQTTDVRLAPAAALCILPDPTQPFAWSRFAGKQRCIILEPRGTDKDWGSKPELGHGQGSVCVLDWVSEGRSARGEHWDCFEYASRTEVWLAPAEAELVPVHWDGAEKGRLLVRDSVVLKSSNVDDPVIAGCIGGRMDELAAFGTLILYGALFQQLGEFFLQEFEAMPRIGTEKWQSTAAHGPHAPPTQETWRTQRLQRETADGVLWTATAVRGAVVIKFGARCVQGARAWLGNMIRYEGTVEAHFGERALLCLK